MEAKRPQKLEEYVGQQHLKEQIKRGVVASKRLHDAFGHTLLTGPAGCGKTSLAQVIANEMEVDFVPLLGSSIRNADELREVFSTRLNAEGYINNDLNPKIPEAIKPTVVFIDEIHNLPLRIRETLYGPMEDRIYWEEETNPWSGRTAKIKSWVPRWTLIGATTKEGSLEKPFLDRFKYSWKVERYTDQECVIFVERASADFKIGKAAIYEIARRSRGTARTAIQLTSRCIDFAMGAKTTPREITITTVGEAFESMRINEDGLTVVDFAILSYLHKCWVPIGVSALASALEEDPKSIEKVYEPFLVVKGLMQRTPRGRVITEQGARYLKTRGLASIHTKRTHGD